MVLQTLNSVSLKDIVRICQYGIGIHHSASFEQLWCDVDFMKLFVRLQISVSFPAQAEVMKVLWDKALCERLHFMFIEWFWDSVWLVLPKEAAMKL